MAIASAKLAAALSDDDVDEIGMTIAYLKRALKAIMTGIDAAMQLRKDGALDSERFGRSISGFSRFATGSFNSWANSAPSGAAGSRRNRAEISGQ